MPIPLIRALALTTTAATVVALNLGSGTPMGPNDLGGNQIPVAAVRLERATSCPEALDAIKGVVRRLAAESAQWGQDHAYGGPGVAVPGTREGAPAPLTAQPTGGVADGSGATPAFSGTNLQEVGIDEPDIVKTDGRVIYAIRHQDLFVVDIASPSILRRIKLPTPATGLLIVGDRLVALGETWNERGSVTLLTVIDVARPEAAKIVTTVSSAGSLRAARLVDGTIRIVVTQTEGWDPYRYDSATGKATLRSPDDIASTITLDRITPSFAKDGVAMDLPRRCSDLYIAPQSNGIESTTVFSLDPTDPVPFGQATVVASTETVYATAESLYIASSRSEEVVTGNRISNWRMHTSIHRFDISDPARAVYASAGDVKGMLLNQWALNERDGLLRVATTIDGVTSNIPVPAPLVDGPSSDSDGVATVAAPDSMPATTESQIVVLRERGENLVPIGHVGGLGLGERIFAVRYLGDLAAVVTFRQTDPLYLIDLSDPTNPRVLGELKIPGFSSYLHPLGDDLLVGVGMDANETGQTLGAQASLFDISDPSDPRRIDQESFAEGSDTPVGWDHHTFLQWGDRIYFPINRWGNQGLHSSIVAVDVSGRSMERVGAVTHPGNNSELRRAVIVGDSLLTLSDNGLMVSTAETLATRDFVAFPEMTYDGGGIGVPEPRPGRPIDSITEPAFSGR